MAYSIVTYGFGPNGSVNVIPIYGFNTNPVIFTAPLIDIELFGSITRSISKTGNIVTNHEFRGNL